ncbi:MAG: ABC transporter substrate-binding protein/permease [Candidatus Acidiferrales bacterium]
MSCKRRNASIATTRVERLILSIALALTAAAMLQPPAAADNLAEIRQRGVLRWGGDQEGGGPYVYPRSDNPNQVTGFEVEIANRLAQKLNVKAQFVQSDWDQLPAMLNTHKIDVILNGYELTTQRAAEMDSSIPYYIYRLQLLNRKGDSNPFTWTRSKRTGSERAARIGVLTGSAAETYMRRFCESTPAGERACEVVGYDGNTDAMQEVETDKLDAALEDSPIASFYASRFPGVTFAGAPVSEGYYVIYANKGDDSLIRVLNDALIVLIRSGELESIYRRYGIWDDAQSRLLDIADTGRFYGYGAVANGTVSRTGGASSGTLALAVPEHGWAVVRNYGGVLLESAGMTVILSVVSFPIAIGLGLLVAVGRLYGPKLLQVPLSGYVEFLRGTPLMLQLYFIFFFLPEIGIRIPAFWTGILGLAINYSAYESEVYRAGLQAVPRGQMEAAMSLGMSRWLAIRRIIAPQAVRLVIPPVVSDFISLYKDTSVCSVITIVELTKRFSVLSMSTQATVELIVMTGGLYLLMSYPVAVLTRRWESRSEVALI